MGCASSRQTNQPGHLGDLGDICDLYPTGESDPSPIQPANNGQRLSSSLFSSFVTSRPSTQSSNQDLPTPFWVIKTRNTENTKVFINVLGTRSLFTYLYI